MSSLPLASWFIIAGIIYLVYRAFSGLLGGRGTVAVNGSMICPNCGIRGEAKTITKGSTLIELLLWLCFIVPGLIYSIWRLSSRGKGCPSCGNTGMIPVNSPIGKKIAEGGA